MQDNQLSSKPLQNIYFETPQHILEQFHIVLVHPKHPKNVGASARAMLNMGLRNLTVVGSKDIVTEEAQSLARSGNSILSNAKFTGDLKEALSEIGHVVGTTRRPTRYDYDTLTPEQIIPSLLERAKSNKIAIIFGPEDTGLQIEHLTFCNQILRIPTASFSPSLNLSQAVLLVCYEIFKQVSNYKHSEKETKEKATSRVVEGLFEQLEEFLLQIDYFPYECHRHTMQLFRQIFRSCELNDYDIGLLRSLIHKTQLYVEHNTKTP